MKILSRFLVVLTLIVGCLGFLGQFPAQALGFSSSCCCVKTKQKIDLNNSDIRDFRDLRGFYPNLAGKIIKNAPYDEINDVLTIPGLSEKQKDQLQANLDKFTVTETSQELTEGDDRFNPGVY